MARRSVLVLAVLVHLPIALLFAEDSQNGIGPSGSQPGSPSDCLGRPSNATPVVYNVLFVQRTISTERPGPEVSPQPNTTRSVNLQGRQQIQNETEYGDVFGEQSSGIDWNRSRIVVVPLGTTYRFDRLDSTVTLSAISQTSDGIYIGLTLTQIGPCQGIAQKDDWFAHDRLNYFVVVPKKPERLIFYTCVVNGCPPGIP